jgi:hypothetical protein
MFEARYCWREIELRFESGRVEKLKGGKVEGGKGGGVGE